jgi:hypothetical protein
VLLGDSSVEVFTDGPATGSHVEAFGYLASQSGRATSISAYLGSTDGVTLALYADASGTPGARLDQGSVASNTAGWTQVPLAGGVAISPGTRYWIAVGANPGGSVTYRDSGSSGSTLDWSSDSGFANPYVANNQWNSNPASLYVSGGISGGGGTTTTTTQAVTTTTQPATTSTLPVTTSTTLLSGGPPGAPPVQVCGNASLLNGPATPPAGAVMVPGNTDNFGQLGSGPLPANTTYYLETGTHTLGTGQFNEIVPGNGDTFIGAPGAVLDGQNSNEYSFTQTATNVTIEYLTIENFVTPFNEGNVNHNGGVGWTISHDTITNTGNTAGGGQYGAAVEGGSNETVTYDCLSNNGQYGLNGATPYGPDNMLIADNEFSHNAPNGESTGGTSADFKLWYDTDVTVENNYFHDSGTVGMWADTNNNGVIMEGNYVINSAYQGLIYEISYNALIENNTFVDNGWQAGPGNPGYPTPAIYVASSGGDSRVSNGLGITTLTITGNQFTDNWDGVQLYQNGDRICGFSDGSTCTLIDPSVYTASACKANIAEKSPIDYFDNCVWKTQNVTVSDNTFDFTQGNIPNCNGTSNTCGFNALFGTYSAEAGHTGPYNDNAISNQQNNVFSDNTYVGPWHFVAFDQGDNPVSISQWTQGFVDFHAGSGDTFGPQDARSTFS